MKKIKPFLTNTQAILLAVAILVIPLDIDGQIYQHSVKAQTVMTAADVDSIDLGDK